MKKIILSLTMASLFSLNDIKAFEGNDGQKKTLAQDETGAKCFDETSHILNLGVGFGGANYYNIYRGAGYDYRRSPAFSISYEQALPKKLGPGYLGLGAYAGYQSASSRYNYYDKYNTYYYYEHKWRNFMIAARGAYHFDFLNSERAEVYAGVLAGLRIQTYDYNSNNNDPDYNYQLNNGSVYPTFSLFAGARWYFVHNIAVFGELGYGISYATVGLSFRL